MFVILRLYVKRNLILCNDRLEKGIRKRSWSPHFQIHVDCCSAITTELDANCNHKLERYPAGSDMVHVYKLVNLPLRMLESLMRNFLVFDRVMSFIFIEFRTYIKHLYKII